MSTDYPLDLPAGPAGIKPDLHLSYDSAATDGASGLRTHQQAGWAGKDWSLGTSFIGLQKLPSGNQADSRYYSLVLGGQSFHLVRGDCRLGATCTTQDLPNPAKLGLAPHRRDLHSARRPRRWRPTPSGATAARATSGRSGPKTAPATTFRRTPGGAGRTAWPPGPISRPTSGISRRSPTRTATRSPTTYGRATKQATSTCATVQVTGNADYDVWPLTISWGANSQTQAPARYQVTFVPISRTLDLLSERALAQVGPPPQETEQLTAIQIQSNLSTAPYDPLAWLAVREYDLGYADAAHSVTSDCTSACSDSFVQKLTLQQIVRKGKDGSALPATTFTYGLTQGGGTYPNGDWNRLVSADNGQGGVVSFSYANIGTALGADPDASAYRNNRRVTQRSIQATPSISYTWQYINYQDPAYNSLGTALKGRGPNAYPNSAGSSTPPTPAAGPRPAPTTT